MSRLSLGGKKSVPKQLEATVGRGPRHASLVTTPYVIGGVSDPARQKGKKLIQRVNLHDRDAGRVVYASQNSGVGPGR